MRTHLTPPSGSSGPAFLELVTRYGPAPSPRLPAKITGREPLLVLRGLQAAAELRAALACALRKAAAAAAAAAVAPAPGGGGREAVRGSGSAALPGNGLSAPPASAAFHILPPRRRDYISAPGRRPRAVGGEAGGAKGRRPSWGSETVKLYQVLRVGAWVDDSHQSREPHIHAPPLHPRFSSQASPVRAPFSPRPGMAAVGGLT